MASGRKEGRLVRGSRFASERGSIDAMLQTAYMDGSASSQGIAMVIASVRAESGHDIAPRIDLSDPVERERLSSSALHAFFRIAELWKIREIDARMLLGGVSENTYRALKKENARTLDEDMIRRISYLIVTAQVPQVRSINQAVAGAFADRLLAWRCNKISNRFGVTAKVESCPDFFGPGANPPGSAFALI